MDGTALVLCFILLFGMGCGSSEGGYGDKPAPGDQAPQSDPAFAAVKPTVDKSCGGCHNGRVHPLTFNSPGAFKTARVKALIESGRMPPNGPLPASDKAALLAYLK